MSIRTRTVSWCEGKILEMLSKSSSIHTYLALSAVVLENVRSIDEQHNLDIAVAQLISKKQVVREKDRDGFTIYRLAA